MTQSSGGSGRVFELFGGIPAAWRLFKDRRTPLWCKAIPVATLAYLIWPFDLLADPALGIGQLDDLAVILLGLRLFAYTANRALPGIVDEAVESDVVDAEFSVLEDD